MPYMSCPICGHKEPPTKGEDSCVHMKQLGIIIAYGEYLKVEGKLHSFDTAWDFFTTEYSRILSKIHNGKMEEERIIISL